MRYRLRTLLIVLALGPPVMGQVSPHLVRDFNAWRRDRAERAKRAEEDAILSQLLYDTSKRQSIRGGHFLNDLYREQPSANEGLGLFDVPVPD